MGQNNDLEREPVRGVIGNTGALPMYYVSKRNSKRPLLFYSKKTKTMAYIYAAVILTIFLIIYGLFMYAVYVAPQPLG